MSSVTAPFSQEENRLARIQPSTPVWASGAVLGAIRGGSSRVIPLMPQRSTSAMRALYQFMNSEMDRLMVR